MSDINLIRYYPAKPAEPFFRKLVHVNIVTRSQDNKLIISGKDGQGNISLYTISLTSGYDSKMLYVSLYNVLGELVTDETEQNYLKLDLNLLEGKDILLTFQAHQARGGYVYNNIKDIIVLDGMGIDVMSTKQGAEDANKA